MKTLKVTDTENNKVLFKYTCDDISSYNSKIKNLKGYKFHGISDLGVIRISKKTAIEISYLNFFSKFFYLIDNRRKEVYCYRTPQRDARFSKEITVVIE